MPSIIFFFAFPSSKIATIFIFLIYDLSKKVKYLTWILTFEVYNPCRFHDDQYVQVKISYFWWENMYYSVYLINSNMWSRIIILCIQVLPLSSLSINSWNFLVHWTDINNFDTLRGATKIINIDFWHNCIRNVTLIRTSEIVQNSDIFERLQDLSSILSFTRGVMTPTPESESKSDFHHF